MTVGSTPHRLQPAPAELAALPPPAPQRTNSWLLALDDARAGRAGTAPVVHDPTRAAASVPLPLPLDASFTEAPELRSRTMPWLVRALVATAAASFLFVVGHTLLTPQRADPKTEVVTPTPTPARRAEPRAQLADPGTPKAATVPSNAIPRSGSAPKSRVTPLSPARPSIPESVAPAASTFSPPRPEDPPPTFIEIPPPDFAPVLDPNARPPTPEPGGDPGASATSSASLIPAWYPGLVSATPLARGELGPSVGELSGSPERRERVQRWLMSQSRAASPLEDTNAEHPSSRLGLEGDSTSTPARGSRLARSTQPAAAKAVARPPVDPSRPEGTWEGAVVPVDQIASKTRILTPKVGLVRVTLASGDVAEGRLHSVGHGQVWIESGDRERAIARSEIERLEQVGPSVGSLAPVPANFAESNARTVAGSRVRVRTAGGLFYGQIVARDGDTLTLETDEGVRVTVEGGSVDPAPVRKTLVKRETSPPKPVVPDDPADADAFDPHDPHGLGNLPHRP